MSIPPRSATNEQPDYSRLDALVYQSLCRDVLQAGGEYCNVEVFGVQGQAQQGADLLAERKRKSGALVGQCKRVQQRYLTVTLLQTAVNEFLEHRKFWKAQGVDTFMLFVSADASDTKIQTERLHLSRRLKRLGIRFVLCSAATLTDWLRPHQGLVTTYFSEEWARILCGSAYPNPSLSAPQVNSFLVAQLEQVTTQFANAAERDIERLREAWRSGNKNVAADGIARYREPSTWHTLTESLKASVLRLLAQLSLDDGSLEQARTFLAEAPACDPEKAQRVQALILRAEGKRDEAIEQLASSFQDESVTLRVALLLEAGDLQKASAQLLPVLNSAEGHRLQALIHLWRGDLVAATDEIEQALLLAPSWTINQYTKGLIDYYSGIAPSAPLQGLPPWPDPVEWSRVKTDDESRERFERAAAAFEGLLGQAGLDKRSRRVLETWVLACLCNDPTKRHAANKRCSGILENDPGNAFCLVWALSRKLEVETKAARELLFSREQQPSGDEQTIAQIICCLEDGLYERALRIISEAKNAATTERELEVWRFWEMQVQALSGVLDLSSSNLEDEAPYLRTIQLRVQGRTNGDWDPLIDELTARHASGDRRATLEVCSLLAHVGRWKDAERMAEGLLECMPTTEAFRLVCNIYYECRSFSQCLHILDTKRFVFPGGELPSAFVRMRISANTELGNVPAAIQSCKEVLELEPTVEHYLALANLYLAAGDFISLGALAARHEQFLDLTSDDLLRLAARLGKEQHALAVRMWQRAQVQGLTDEQVVGAIGIGYNLGQDAYMRSLHDRLNRMPDNENLRRFTTEDLVQMAQNHQTAVQETLRLYRIGEACLHICNFPQPLSFWYHRLLKSNRESQGGGTSVYTRSGWRSDAIFPKPGKPIRLHADTTALLTANEFGLLNVFEQAFKPIMLPHDTLRAFAAMREQVSAKQPAREGPLRAVRNAFDAGWVRVFAPETEQEHYVGEDDAPQAVPPERRIRVTVEYGSITERRTGQLDAAGFLSPRNLLEALASLGKVSAEGLNLGREQFVVEFADDTHTTLPAQATVITSVSILEGFARAHILKELCSTFEVHLASEHEVALLNGELRSFIESEEDYLWLTDLIDRLRAGLESGSYHLMQIVPSQAGAEALADGSLPLSCLAELLGYPAEDGDILWTDDRMVNGFARREGALIVDTVDLAKHLAETGSLTSEAYFSFRQRYRFSNLHFLELDKAELLHALSAARSSDGSFVETLELKVIRQHFARSIADATALQITVPSSGRLLEWPFLIGSATAVTEALTAIWKKASPDKLRAEKSWWLTYHLYLPDRGRSSTNFERTALLDLLAEATTLAVLIAGTVQAWRASEGGPEARKHFILWLWSNVIYPRFEADPTLETEALRVLREILFQVFSMKSRTDEQQRALSTILGSWLEDLPHDLRHALSEKPDFLVELGITLSSAILIAGTKISARPFWNAVKEYSKSQESIALGKVVIGSTDDHRYPVVEICATRQRHILTDAPFGLFSKHSTVRLSAAKTLAQTFRLPKSATEVLVKAAKGKAAPESVMKIVADLKLQSAELFYDNLQSRIAGGQVEKEDIVPLRHFMIQSYLCLADGVTTDDYLIEEIGALSLEDALGRFTALPRLLPRVLVERMENAGASKRRSLFKSLLARPSRLPLKAAHLSRLLFLFLADTPAYSRLARAKLRAIANAELTAVKAFSRILEKMEAELWLAPAFRDVSGSRRLLYNWLHSVKVFEAFEANHVDMKWVGESFGTNSQRLPSTMLAEDQTYCSDVIHPSELRPWNFILALMAFASDDGRLLPPELRSAISQLDEAHPDRALGLLANKASQPNATGSFLAEASGWTNVLIAPASELVANTREPFACRSTAQALLEDQNSVGWIHLNIILGSGGIPESARGEIEQLLKETDFNALCLADEDSGFAALTFASNHASIFGGEVLARVRAQILSRAASLSSPESSKASRHVAGALLSFGYNLYKNGSFEQGRYSQVSELWEEIVRLRPSIGSLCLDMVERLMRDLPNRDARHFWRLQSILRADSIR